MGRIVFAALSPHAAVLIDRIGGIRTRQVQNTVEALEALRNRLEVKRPETLIVLSPHINPGPAVLDEKYLIGDFGDFDHPEMKLKFAANQVFNQALCSAAGLASFPLHKVYGALDYASLVPLYFLCQGIAPKVVSLGVGFPSPQDAWQFGEIIASTIQRQGGNYGLIASGDLSHRLTADGPAGYHPDGARFDRLLLELLEKCDVEGLFNLPFELIENAGQCGLGPLGVVLSCIRGGLQRTEVLSYEGPFGVGYGVVDFLLEGGP
ncbi:MAG: AmmeMemoRadiSam system protein B [Limnochordia bacterium]|jgi:aromatic ring-opening dioxygenase LigB subunit|nr:AmmeMemoRadiSam system protein B [Limnochordia bacterium]